MTGSFIPRAAFGALDSLPRTYYLGHHAAGLSKMRRMLSQIDIVIECRDSRIPLTSRNPMFEEALAEKERILVYTKKDLTGGLDSKKNERVNLLRQCHAPSAVHFSNHRSDGDIGALLKLLRKRTIERNNLTAHCMVVGMPNVGKSTLLNALRSGGMHKGKAARTGAQPGVTRKIGTAVKILESDEERGYCPVYILDTPGVFIPYVPDSEAILKFAVCGHVKDNIITPFIVADYLLFHINQHDPSIYSEYHPPTNDIVQLLEAMARKIGRLQKGGTTDLESTALWMIQRWRVGELGTFMLDAVNSEEVESYRNRSTELEISQNQARKAGKRAAKELAAERRKNSGGPA